MKASERIRRNMQPNRPMMDISFRLPVYIVEDLKEIAAAQGFGSFEALIRAYISSGLREDLAEREAQSSRDAAVQEFSNRLISHGVPEAAVQQAAAEMRTGT